MVNQQEIVNRIAEKTGLKKKYIKEVIFAFKDVVKDVIAENKILFLKEVFMIKPIDVKARNRYIAPYGKIIHQAEHKTVKIIPSTKLIDIIRKS